MHTVGTNNAAGNAPGLLTQIMWMGSLVTALILFIAGGNAMKAGASRLSSISMQPAAGVVIVGIASGFLVWMASSWYGMELAQAWDTWLFLWLVGATFYMLQSALLNWIGMRQWGFSYCLCFSLCRCLTWHRSFCPKHRMIGSILGRRFDSPL